MRHERVTVLGVPVPDEDFDVRERMSKTLSGIGGVDCPAKASCQLEVLRALEERDERWERRLQGIERQVSEMRGILLQWAGSKGIRNSDSTPVKGSIAVEAGPVKFRGKAWLIVVVLLALGAMAAGAYVLGEWGRPTATVAPAK